jgi:hypothetical protein
MQAAIGYLRVSAEMQRYAVASQKRRLLVRKSVPASVRISMVRFIARNSLILWWAVLGSNQWPLPCETGVGCLRINDM